MSRIGVNLFACDSGRSGISQYMINLLEGFGRLHTDDEFILFIAREDQSVFPLPSPKFCFELIHNFFNKPSVNIIWQQTHLPFLMKKHRLDAMFMPAANRRLTWYSRIPTIGTLHDLCQFHIDNKYDRFRMFYVKKILPLLAKKLTLIITPSQSSKNDVIRFYGITEEKINVIFNGIDHKKFYPREKNIVQEKLKQHYGINAPYLLYLSRLEHPGKNHLRLIDAFNTLKKSHQIEQKLVLVGADWNGSDVIHARVNELGLENEVIFPGFVAGEDLPLFVSGTDLFVYPSLYEGFGIPVIEAMACGVPVACSNVSSLPEIVGNGAMLFDPTHTPDMTQKILDLLQTPLTRETLIQQAIVQAARFDWDLAAQTTLHLIKQAIAPR